MRRRRRRSAPATAPVEPLRSPDDLDLFRATTVDRRAMRAAVRPLARQLARRVAQRRRLQRQGRLDVRRTMRRSLGSGGVPFDPSFRRRRASKADVVVLCDLSGSVAEFAEFTLTLVHALHHELARLRSFVFVDGVAEVTDLIERAEQFPDPHHLLRRPGVVAGDGHSDYGRAFERFWTVARRHRAHAAHDADRDRRRPHQLPRRRPGAVPADGASGPAAPTGSTRSRAPTGTTATPASATTRRYCAAVFEVRSLRQLADAVRRASCERLAQASRSRRATGG